MGIALLIFWFAYCVLALIAFLLVKKFIKLKWIVVLTALILILYPFRRAIFYKTVFYFYGRSPLQEIHETVEYPISVYWEDNVWPGWDEHGRQLMVENYLDGIHLKALALNGDDGKIYLYRANKNSFTESTKIWPEYIKEKQIWDAARVEAKKIINNGGSTQKLWNDTRTKWRLLLKTRPKGYVEQKRAEIKQILGDREIYQGRTSLPPMDYRVRLDFLPRSLLVNSEDKIIHADRVSIIDVKEQKEIAYSVRYMAYGGFLNSRSYDYRVGDIHAAYELDEKVLFEYANVLSTFKSQRCYLKHIFN